MNKRLSTKTRHVDDWLPILFWTEGEVWTDIRASRVPHHHAYDEGMPRLSCVFCVFAPRDALLIAGRLNRELLDEYVAVEDRVGWSFRKNLSLREIRDAVDAGEMPRKVSSWTA